MSDFENEIKSDFLLEAMQILTQSEQLFLTLERDGPSVGIVDQIFRLAHNLKGSSKAVGFSDLGAITHEFETLLLKIKHQEIPMNQPIVTLILKCIDRLREIVTTLQGNFGACIECGDLVAEIQSVIQSGGQNENLQSQSPHPPEVSFEKLESVVAESLTAPAPVSTPVPVAPTPQPTRQPAQQVTSQTSPQASTGEENIRVSLHRLERLINYVGELVILHTVMREQAVMTGGTLLRRTTHQSGKVIKELQDLSMSLRMLPLKSTFLKMQRIVRDTAAVLNKKVDLILVGEETEVDKTVLENIGDPLVHLIRNAVDHGIETPEVRKKAGKSETGRIILSARQQSGRLVIEIADDGGGMHVDRLMAKAKEKGLLRADETLDQDEALKLIFRAGFSTKEVVSEVSGRGVGMDVVKTNIELLHGQIQVETNVGKGSVFRIVLPLTLAIIEGMVVNALGQRYVVPLSHLREFVRLGPENVRVTTGVGDVLLLRGENLPLFRLKHLLGFTSKNSATVGDESIALVISSGQRVYAVTVDDIAG